MKIITKKFIIFFKYRIIYVIFEMKEKNWNMYETMYQNHDMSSKNQNQYEKNEKKILFNLLGSDQN